MLYSSTKGSLVPSDIPRKNCTALKLKVQAKGERVYELDFAKLTEEPDVNPLPNHGKAVNAIDGELACRRKRDLSDVKFPMKAIFKVLFLSRSSPAGVPGSQPLSVILRCFKCQH
ncbi:hypothetical protein Pint_06929 [Pistacia integerrima]|uniref:Uncharacterized protein n=1 Tax=Pistacia integerrima TaxID=434235 RepID=A0ACC0XTY3_9ROSI|nr:hypothetical protein Pint_06929 [Pistacia integerrima]